MDRLSKIKTKLITYGEEHLLNFYDELDEKEKENFLNSVDNLDLNLIQKLYNERHDIQTESGEICPIDYVDKLKLSDEEIKRYTTIGEEAIKRGELGFATLAGGQGTRLGHTGPKGTYIIEEINKSLFEIMSDSLKRAKSMYNVYIPWYIMTSRENNDDTVKFFEENNYFGYPKEEIMFFKQGELPMLLEDGKIILETKCKIKEAADGHGGIFEAMHKNGVIKDMGKRQVKWIFIGGIDNILLKMVDPLFLGTVIEKNVKLASKSIIKANPEEKVGVFCKRNGKPSVIEYTEITKEMANMKKEDGELLYAESHILCNLFSIDALKQIGNEKLPYHTAFKKCNYIDENGKEIVMDTPNAYKFEAFIFDAFNKFDDMLIFRALREEEFAPIKGKTGIDSVETATALYKKYWKI